MTELWWRRGVAMAERQLVVAKCPRRPQRRWGVATVVATVVLQCRRGSMMAKLQRRRDTAIAELRGDGRASIDAGRGDGRGAAGCAHRSLEEGHSGGSL